MKNIILALFTVLSITECNQQHDMVKGQEVAIVHKQIKWTVNYSVKGNKVYVDCFIPGFSFIGSNPNDPDYEDGHIAVKVDGKFKQNVYQSAFVLEELPKGVHVLTLELKRKNGSSYGVSKELQILIKTP
ncbi:hypothetical protein [Fictibacillus gelatini]|uniref:hypothetical protein n=1 Tax=Fictibacillus gelatini TaxID=225985 RepID=UPI00041139D2|nr:hypothetical protein [Fictibacillus gelatini]